MEASRIMHVSLFYHARRSTRRWTIAGALAALLVVAAVAEPAAAAPPTANMHWHEIDTAHCRIFKWQTSTTPSDDLYLKSVCEEAMTRVSTYWFGKVLPLDRKCDVILYPSDESYSHAVGGNAIRTAGSVLTGYDGELSFFRIELRARRSDWVAALPHELTHVLFAQRFAGRKLPAWINEGTALMADPTSKQILHLRDHRQAQANGSALPMATLLSLNDYPAQRDWPALYGQSLSLVKCLVERKSPQAFVAFIDKSLQTDCETGFREVYNIHGLNQLRQIWTQYWSHTELASAGSDPTRFNSSAVVNSRQ
jgi:hypothetical protein